MPKLSKWHGYPSVALLLEVLCLEHSKLSSGEMIGVNVCRRGSIGFTTTHLSSVLRDFYLPLLPVSTSCRFGAKSSPDRCEHSFQERIVDFMLLSGLDDLHFWAFIFVLDLFCTQKLVCSWLLYYFQISCTAFSVSKCCSRWDFSVREPCCQKNWELSCVVCVIQIISI